MKPFGQFRERLCAPHPWLDSPFPLGASIWAGAASEKTFGLMLPDRRVKQTASSSCQAWVLIVLT